MDTENYPRKKSFKVVVTSFLALVLMLSAFVVWRAYTNWSSYKRIEEAGRLLKQREREIYNRQISDTYGGKTPQETLRMYIEAVEAGDYELASKYFVESKQEQELRSLKNSLKENIENVQNLLKQSLASRGSYSSEKDRYGISRPLSVDFILYPNGIWKIIEI